MRAVKILIVLVVTIATSCFGGKKGSGRVGTNVGDGTGSDHDGPWNRGGGSSPALTGQQP
jgi:hypothetical protein